MKKAWKLLDQKQKKYAFFIFILMLVTMVLESLSVAIVVPLISILLEGNIDKSIFSYFFAFEKPTGKDLIYIGLSVTFIIFLIKNLTLIFNLWQKTIFLQKLHFDLINRLFNHYLRNDYMFFLQNNSAYLYRNLTDVINAFVKYFSHNMVLFSEIIVFIGIGFILFSVDFLGTTAILLSVSITAFVIYKLTIKTITSLGKERLVASGTMNKHLLQGMASAKDIKILDRESDLIVQVNKSSYRVTKIGQIATFLNAFPRFPFEIFMVIAFSALVFVMVEGERNIVDIIKYLGVFAVASIRLVPGASRLLQSYQLLKYMQPSVKLLIQEFNSHHKPNMKENYKLKKIYTPFQFQKAINLSNLSFTYPTRKEFSISKVSMNIKRNDFIGIIGKTGSGKSTLVNILVGLVKPTEGKVEVDGANIDSNLSGWHEKIGYVPQSVYLIDDTINKNIAFGLGEKDIDHDLIKQAVEKANLSEFINNLSNGLETIVGEKGIRISGGQQQRIGIARALYRNPEILILDEATSSLDETTEKKIMESIKFLKNKKTLIVITHRLTTVSNCDKIYFIDNGRVVNEGTPKKILNNI